MAIINVELFATWIFKHLYGGKLIEVYVDLIREYQKVVIVAHFLIKVKGKILLGISTKYAYQLQINFNTNRLIYRSSPDMWRKRSIGLHKSQNFESWSMVGLEPGIDT